MSHLTLKYKGSTLTVLLEYETPNFSYGTCCFFMLAVLSTPWIFKKFRTKNCVIFNLYTNINHKWDATWENQQSAHAKTKTQISFAVTAKVTAKLISIFVFGTWIVQYLYFLNTKFQASSHFQWLYKLVCVRPGQNPHCWFSHVAAHLIILSKCPYCTFISKLFWIISASNDFYPCKFLLGRRYLPIYKL